MTFAEAMNLFKVYFQELPENVGLVLYKQIIEVINQEYVA